MEYPLTEEFFQYFAFYVNAYIFPRTGTVSGRKLSIFMSFKHSMCSLGGLLINFSMVWDSAKEQKSSKYGSRIRLNLCSVFSRICLKANAYV